MKRFLAILCAVALTLSLHYIPAQAQVGPAGLNPANFIIAGAAAADTSSLSTTLGDSTHITWICGLAVSGTGATAATTTSVTVGPFAGLSGVTGTLNFSYTFPTGATVGSTPLLVNFTPCLPSPGITTLTVPGAAGNTLTNLAIWGYKQ